MADSRVAVVTGAAGGIGAAICDVLSAEGWAVVAADQRPVDRPGALQFNLAHPDAVAERLAELGPIDVLVNNGAMQLFKRLVDTTTAEWDDVLDVNLRGAFLCTRALWSQLAARRGAVVNVASVHAVATSMGTAAYAGSKGGLLALTRAAALELAEHSVRVNAVLPGAIETAALRAGLERAPDAERKLISRTPLRRTGRPVEVAQAVAFLADSERSGFITGACLTVDGGATCQLSTEA